MSQHESDDGEELPFAQYVESGSYRTVSGSIQEPTREISTAKQGEGHGGDGGDGDGGDGDGGGRGEALQNNKETKQGIDYVDPEDFYDEASEGDSEMELLTIDDCLDKTKFGWYQLLCLTMCVCAWSTDGSQPMTISLIKDKLDWDVSSLQKSLIVFSLYFGMMFGSLIFGYMADVWGRKIVLMITNCGILVSVMMESLSVNIWMLLVFIFLNGLSCGGNLPLVYSYFSEILPQKGRGFWLTGLACSWSLGELYVSGFAWAFQERWGWRWVLRWSMIPCMIAVVLLFFLKSSPRFLLKKGRMEDSVKVLQHINRWNCKNVNITNETFQYSPESKKKKGIFSSIKIIFQIFSKKYLTSTLSLWFLWFFASIALYNIQIFLPEFFKKKGIEGVSGYPLIFLSSLGNIPGVLTCAVAIEIIGRKPMLCLLCLIGGLLLIPFGITNNFWFLLVLLIMEKFCLYGLWGILDILPAEIYNTEIRSIGNAMANLQARVAGMITPFLLGFLFEFDSVWPALGVAGGVLLVTALFSILPEWLGIPETKGKHIE